MTTARARSGRRLDHRDRLLARLDTDRPTDPDRAAAPRVPWPLIAAVLGGKRQAVQENMPACNEACDGGEIPT